MDDYAITHEDVGRSYVESLRDREYSLLDSDRRRAKVLLKHFMEAAGDVIHRYELNHMADFAIGNCTFEFNYENTVWDDHILAIARWPAEVKGACWFALISRKELKEELREYNKHFRAERRRIALLGRLGRPHEWDRK